jgi:hypothetical protein
MLFMNKIKKFKIYTIYIITTILIILMYVPFLSKNMYFSYWDTYSYKTFSYNILNWLKVFHSDIIYYFNQIIFNKITWIDYYYILKYWSIFFLFLFILWLSLLLKEIFKNNWKLNNYINIFIPISILYTSLFHFFYVRNTMTMRENFVFFVMLIAIYLLIKYKEKILTNNNIFVILLILHIYIIYWHTLVNIIYTLVIYLYFFILIIKYKFIYIKKILLYTSIFFLLSLPIIYDTILWIYIQINSWDSLIKKQWVSLAYNYIRFNYFNWYDYIIFLLSTLIFLKYIKKIDKIWKIYVFIISLGYFTAFIPQIWAKQNRYSIYIFIFFSFLFILFNYRIKNFFITNLILIVVLCTWINKNIISYRWYFPINDWNINLLINNIDKWIININKKVYCWRSVCLLLSYFYPDKQNNFIDVELVDLNTIHDIIVYFKDDLEWYKSNNKELYDFINNNNNNNLD